MWSFVAVMGVVGRLAGIPVALRAVFPGYAGIIAKRSGLGKGCQETKLFRPGNKGAAAQLNWGYGLVRDQTVKSGR